MAKMNIVCRNNIRLYACGLACRQQLFIILSGVLLIFSNFFFAKLYYSTPGYYGCIYLYLLLLTLYSTQYTTNHVVVLP